MVTNGLSFHRFLASGTQHIRAAPASWVHQEEKKCMGIISTNESRLCDQKDEDLPRDPPCWPSQKPEEPQLQLTDKADLTCSLLFNAGPLGFTTRFGRIDLTGQTESCCYSVNASIQHPTSAACYHSTSLYTKRSNGAQRKCQG